MHYCGVLLLIRCQVMVGAIWCAQAARQGRAGGVPVRWVSRAAAGLLPGQLPVPSTSFSPFTDGHRSGHTTPASAGADVTRRWARAQGGSHLHWQQQKPGSASGTPKTTPRGWALQVELGHTWWLGVTDGPRPDPGCMIPLLLSASSANRPKEFCDAAVTEKQLYQKAASCCQRCGWRERGKIREDVALNSSFIYCNVKVICLGGFTDRRCQGKHFISPS